MINKQSLWFITLFSLIVILSIYYFKNGETTLSLASLVKDNTNDTIISDANNLDVLKITNDEKTVSEINDLNKILLDDEATLEEKNDAYDSIEVISNRKKVENEITSLLKKELNYDAFVKINDNNITVTIFTEAHNNEIANKIINKVRDHVKSDIYITIKFDQK